MNEIDEKDIELYNKKEEEYKKTLERIKNKKEEYDKIYSNFDINRIIKNVEYLKKRSEEIKKQDENKDDKSKKDKNVIFPGPGAYNVRDNLFSKCVHFTKEKKFRVKKDITPGPGQYKIPTSFDYISDYTRSKGAFDPSFKSV